MKQAVLSGLRSLILLVSVLMFGSNAKANHINGMDLGYTWVSGNTYRITLSVYGNCSSTAYGTSNLHTATPYICIYNAGTYVKTDTLHLLDSANVSNVCAADMSLTSCTVPGSTIQGTMRFRYTDTVTLTTTSHYWRFIFDGNMGGGFLAGRLTTLTNIVIGGGGSIIALTDTVDNIAASSNSSPTLSVIPTPYYCVGNADNYNPGGTDPDGDVLKFSLVNATQPSGGGGGGCSNPTNVTYTGTYTGANPLSYVAGTFSFNSSNGAISFTPNAANVYDVVYNIREFRGGVFVGSSQREMNFLCQTCSIGAPWGDIVAATGLGTIADTVHYQICQNKGAFTFTIKGSEPDTTNSIYVTPIGVPSGLTYVISNDSTNHPTIVFSGNSNTLAPGIYTFSITYQDNVCPISGSNTIAYYVTVGATPPMITGSTFNVCVGSSVTFNDALTGGTWSLSSTSIASVGATTGVLTGMSTGSDFLTYTTSVGCTRDTTINVLLSPQPIVGTLSECVGNTTTLTDVTTGGTWSVLNTNASITAGGVVTGNVAGFDTVKYLMPSTGCFVTALDTINGVPANITGGGTVCVGSNLTLADVTTGGSWTSSDTTKATVVGSGTNGIITGVASGVVTITYSLGTGCFKTKLVTVNPLPNGITGSASVCVSSVITLAETSTGGTWSATNGHATVAAGVVTGVTVGLDTISYTFASTGCAATFVESVISGPAAIVGGPGICLGSSVSMTDATSGGTWSSSNTAIATIGSTTGVATGVSVGTWICTFQVGVGCYVTAPMTVNPLPAAIGGPNSVCPGSNITLTDVTTGGTWSSNPVTIATIVPATGVLTGVASGLDTVSYTVTLTGCKATKIVTVNSLPAAITGSASLCVGATTPLTDASTGGGTWSASNGHATIAGTGVVTGVSAGSDTITFTSAVTTCYTTRVETVNNLPNPITGPTSGCVGVPQTLVETSTGGTWIASNGNATISGTGIATGVSAGVDTISYSLGTGCVATRNFTVNPNPQPITGSAGVCVGATDPLTETTTGGTWSSSNILVASVSAAGVVTGVAVGSVTISYSLPTGCYATFSVTVSNVPVVAPITGATSVCVGSTIPLSDVTTGGAWSSVTIPVATISVAGVVTGASAGTDSIYYSVTNGCGTARAGYSITVNPTAVAGSISGPDSVCQGSSITLLDAATGGVWSASNGNATVAAGVVTGVTAGTVTISYTVTNGCGPVSATYPVTVNIAPTAAPIGGPSIICQGSFALLTETSTGGTWSSSDNTVATVSGTGVVTGIAAGTATISYSILNPCGTASALKPITVNPLPPSGSIVGPSSVCVGNTISLTDGVSGGSWVALNTHASVGAATGVVTGVSAGIDTILYRRVNGCGTTNDTTIVTIITLPAPGAITGSSTVCAGTNITLSDALTGGSWSASNTNAAVDAVLGVVTGIIAGTDIITYTAVNMCGSTSVTKTVTINGFPVAGVISGPNNVCVGANILLTESVSGGVWISGDATVATVGSSSGIVTGVGGGTDTISYEVTNTCGTVGTFMLLTVNTLPDTGLIAGPSAVCVGSSILLTESVTGGIWSAGNSDATVAGGLVTGVIAGVDPISYSLTNMCGTASAVFNVTVVAFPVAGSISGPSNVCVGSAITLLESVTGGTWFATNGNALIIGPGIVSGVTVGIDTIVYMVSNLCGSVSSSIVENVNPVPFVAAISGPTDICVGGFTSLTDAVTGGDWTSSNTSVATIDIVTGLVSGISGGSAIITYTVTNTLGCPSSVTLTEIVHAVPVIPAITGTTHECLGGTSVLSDMATGGTWSSSNIGIASVSATGTVTGVSVGVATISYSVTNICGTNSVVVSDTVVAPPVVNAISGLASACVGGTSVMTDATSGGTWSSSDLAVATVGTTGVVTGVAAGTSLISYTVLNSYGCSTSASTAFVVNPLPAVSAISGVTNECIAGTTSLSDATSAGTWSSSNAAIASIDASGVVTGNTGGVVTISYSVSDMLGCVGIATVSDTVNTVPVPTPITGTMTVCVGGSTSLSDAALWGVWSSGNPSLAFVATGTGVVTGVSAGTVTIYYNVTNSCGTAIDSASVTVNPLPVVPSISGPSSTVCAGTTTTLTDAATGGVWSSSNVAIATVGSTSGAVTGVSAGTATISYRLTNSFGCSNYATYGITFGASMGSSSVLPAGTATICAGNPVYLHVVTTATGITYQWYKNGIAIAGATNFFYYASSAGNYSVTISNGVCEETLTGAFVSVMSAPIISFTTPNILSTGSYSAYQWFKNGAPVAGANSSIYFETGAGSYTVVVTDINGCSDTSEAYIIGGGGGTGVANVNNNYNVHIYPNPVSSILHIDATLAINVRIFTPEGKIVIEQNNATDVNVGDLADGLYFIMIYDQNEGIIKTDRFMKMK